MLPEHPEHFFSAKCIFRSELIEDGKFVSIFEERIVLVRGFELDEAFDKAEQEAKKYAAENKSAFLACVGVYIVQDPIEDGAEVFSVLRESNTSNDDYLKTYYQTHSERDSFLFQSKRGLDSL